MDSFKAVISHLRLCLVFAVCCIQMAKTHLEHQPLIYRLKPYHNGSTTYNPYYKYSVKEGITTATILGTTFILIILYIAFKITWPKMKKRCYKHEGLLAEAEAQLLRRTNDAEAVLNKTRDQRVPIILRVVDEDVSPSQHISTTQSNHDQSDMTHEVEEFTMVLSTHAKKPHYSKQPEPKMTNNNTIVDDQEKMTPLPPLVDQVLRTAHWVNSVSTRHSITDSQLSLYNPDTELKPNKLQPHSKSENILHTAGNTRPTSEQTRPISSNSPLLTKKGSPKPVEQNCAETATHITIQPIENHIEELTTQV